MALRMKNSFILLAAIIFLTPVTNAQEWVSLFNGKDLSGWVPKFTGSPLGENYKNTFVVKDGVIRADYGQYTVFDAEFGHLFYKRPFETYKLRLEYRIHGEQIQGGPTWGFRNSGVMVLSQSPESMALGQFFPVSIEFQFLSQKGEGKRPTGRLCTPGTHVEINGKLITQHCTDNSADTFRGDGWVKAEIHVLPDGQIIHFVNGEQVLSYSAPQLDQTDKDAQRLIAAGHPIMLSKGYIALQAESHPVDFRNIEILELHPK
jgi:hypothetical protein